MTPEAQRIAIAEACGWTRETRRMYAGARNVEGWGKNQHLELGDRDRDFTISPNAFPDYLNDLNAMHVAERALKDQQQDAYIDWLLQCIVVPAEAEFGVTFSDTDTMWVVLHSTAAQRAEAFLRTIGKWKERA